MPKPEGVDGKDFSHLFENPTASGRNFAYYQYPACGMKSGSFNQTRGGCNNVPKEEFDYMGYSLRTKEWRYTVWLVWNQTSLRPEWDASESEEELYSHHGDDSEDMDKWENENLANSQPQIAAALRKQLRTFFE